MKMLQQYPGLIIEIPIASAQMINGCGVMNFEFGKDKKKKKCCKKYKKGKRCGSCPMNS